jgi:hypothetical protein
MLFLIETSHIFGRSVQISHVHREANSIQIMFFSDFITYQVFINKIITPISTGKSYSRQPLVF